MKNFNSLNYFLAGIPLTLILIGYLFVNSLGSLIGFGLLSLIITGIFQIITGISMLINDPKDKMLQLYIGLVVFFFLTLTFNIKILNSDILYFILIPAPPMLAIYFSIILYKKKQS